MTATRVDRRGEPRPRVGGGGDQRDADGDRDEERVLVRDAAQARLDLRDHAPRVVWRVGCPRAAQRYPHRPRAAPLSSDGRRGPARPASRARAPGVTFTTSQASPTRSRPRISQPEGSNSYQRRPWKAERGKAWWLWCQASPSDGQRQPEDVRRLVVGVEAAAAEEVADRVDAPGDVVHEEDPHEAAPQQRRAAPPPSEPPLRAKPSAERHARLSQPISGKPAVDAPHQRVLEQVGRVALRGGLAVGLEQPADVRVPEARRHAAQPSPPACGLCGSPSWSVNAWCLRWSATQSMHGALHGAASRAPRSV